MNADDPDLSHVGVSGKKIILWHGWADVGLIPLRTIQYYKAVQQTVGKARTDEFLRLFMVPGMYHCEGGPGPDIFDDLAALEDWVEQGEVPEQMIAYKTSGQNSFYPHRAPGVRQQKADEVLRSRPLCSYPRVARYNGQGSIDEAQNFRCIQP
jgi:feruloyl esterase